MILQDKLQFLLNKYNVPVAAAIIDEKRAEIGGEAVDLLPWRCERRFIEMKNMVHDGTLEGISVFKACRIEKKGIQTADILYRELDLCEWIIGSRVAEIMTFENKDTAISIAKLENGVICTLEAAATLCPGTQPIDKHEITAKRGFVCDRAVDTQIPQQSIYLYGDNTVPQTYTDVDYELLGLNTEEIALVRQTLEAAKNKNLINELNSSAKHLKALISFSHKATIQKCNIRVEG